MKTFPQNITFKYSWRTYQQRVLNELEAHLDDNRLHIIAPPGSGKTVLGLEVGLRLNKPTLILAPTIAIRNQWIQRFCELFLQVAEEPDWISRDIKNPRFFTVLTYQALHAVCTNTIVQEEDEEIENGADRPSRKTIDTTKLVAKLKKLGIGTFVLDEAHHLKNEWWKSLDAVANAVNPTIVGLTATPPYDVSYTEWQRYTRLNGPVDAEISVPELVVESNLCPHQDYIYLSTPTREEEAVISKQRAKALQVFEDIKKDEVLIQALIAHPIYTAPKEHLEWIYARLENYAATLIFLNAVGQEVSKNHLEVIGDTKYKIPELNYEWVEILLTFYLFEGNEHFGKFVAHQEQLINKLKYNGLLTRKTVNFREHKRINRSLSASLSKLQSIDHIVNIEHNTLGHELRMVILTDYIRKEFLLNAPDNPLVLRKIGVLPIFEKLRRTNDRQIKLGVLSGSLVIIPQTALGPLIEAARRMQIDAISHTPLPYDNNFLIINTNERVKNKIVHLITNIFEAGEIEVLIGTKSLLGEGWDAPSINALILASFVGSYVLSNQMRGRAIRTQRTNPNKTSNIWHLVCVDSTVQDGGDDFQVMARRFKSFVGVSNSQELSIENGINRLHLPKVFSNPNIASYNANIIEQAGNREVLQQKWTEALGKGIRLIEEIKVPFPKGKEYQRVKSLYYKKTIAYLVAALGSNLLIVLEWIFKSLGKAAKYIHSLEDMFRWLMAIGVISFVVFGRQFFKTLMIYIKYRDISKDIQQIGEALLHSLVKMGTIQTDISKLNVVSSMDTYGAIYCHLNGGTTFETSIFIKSLQEIVSAIESPRYLILRKSLFLKVISQRDYHAVPDLIGKNKKTAVYFKSQWQRLVGSCQLIYTRTIKGRKVLLKSRIHSLSSEFEDSAERVNKWR